MVEADLAVVHFVGIAACDIDAGRGHLRTRGAIDFERYGPGRIRLQYYPGVKAKAAPHEQVVIGIEADRGRRAAAILFHDYVTRITFLVIVQIRLQGENRIARVAGREREVVARDGLIVYVRAHEVCREPGVRHNVAGDFVGAEVGDVGGGELTVDFGGCQVAGEVGERQRVTIFLNGAREVDVCEVGGGAERLGPGDGLRRAVGSTGDDQIGWMDCRNTEHSGVV